MRACTIEEVRWMAKGDLETEQKEGETDEDFRERIAKEYEVKLKGTVPLLCEMVRGRQVG